MDASTSEPRFIAASTSRTQALAWVRPFKPEVYLGRGLKRPPLPPRGLPRGVQRWTRGSEELTARFPGGEIRQLPRPWALPRAVLLKDRLAVRPTSERPPLPHRASAR